MPKILYGMLKSNVQTSSVRSQVMGIVLSVIFLFLFVPVMYGQSSDQISDRFSEARHHFNYREYQEAIDILESIRADVCNSDEMVETCVELHIIKMNSYRNLNDYETAEKHFDAGYSLAQSQLHEHHPLRVRLYTERFSLENQVTSVADAGVWAKNAMEIVEEALHTGLTKADAYRVMGYYNDGIGNYDLAIENYQEALSELEGKEQTIEVVNMLAIIHNNIGISYRRVGELQTANQHYQINLSLVREAFGDNHLQLAYVYNNIGTTYYFIGDYGIAGDYFRRTANIIRINLGEDNPLYALSLNNAVSSYMSLNDYDRALELMQRVQEIKLRTSGEEHSETAYGYSNLGNVLTQMGKYEEALKNHMRSIEIRINLYGEDHPGLVTSYFNISDLFVRMDEYEKARDYLGEARRIVDYRLGENHPQLWEAQRRIGQSYAAENRHDEAINYFSESMYRMIDRSNMPLVRNPDFSRLIYPLDFMNTIMGMGNANLQLYKSGAELKNLHEAYYYFNLAADFVDFMQIEFQSEASKLNLIDENYAIYTNAIESGYYLYKETSDDSWLDEILRLNELSRARIAIELVQDLEARQFAGVPGDILDEERELNTTITDLYNQIHLEQEKGFDADETLIAQYRDSLFYAKENLQNFIRLLEGEYPAYYNLKYERPLVNKFDVMNLLSSDETLLSYMFTDDYLFAILVNLNGISIHKLELIDQLPSHVEELRQAVIRGDTETYVELSVLLYDKLMGPLADHIQTESVIIIPDQILHYLPFELLLTERPSDMAYHRMPFLIREKQISYTQSATLLQYKTNRRPSNPENLLAMAPFNLNVSDLDESYTADRYLADLTPLPLTRYETRRIAEIFNTRRTWFDFLFPVRTDIFLDREATKMRLFNSPLDDYGFIHLATHAFVHEGNPALSGIALWGDENSDGIVRVGDIYNLRLNADLVVLGACETGLGRMYRGEGLIGFTRAFIYAGASNLVVSMWRVSDQPTAMLMIHFYEKIRQGHSYSEALQAAKLELINHPEHAAPRNWAAFVFQGR
jgi:CHAT domain-containing protein